MDSYEWNVQESSSFSVWVSQLVFWGLEEGMDMLTNQGHAGNEHTLIHCPYISFQEKVWFGLKVSL